MHQAVKNAAVDDRTAADARADGEIKKVGQVLRRAPARLAERGSVHVGVKTNRHAQSIAHRARQIVILPSRLWRGGDIAECKRGAVQIDRPKRTDPHRLQFALWTPRAGTQWRWPAWPRARSWETASSSGPPARFPTPQTNLVPPASIEPNIFSICAPRSLPQNLAGTKFRPPQKTSEDFNGHASPDNERSHLTGNPCPAHRRFRPPIRDWPGSAQPRGEGNRPYVGCMGPACRGFRSPRGLPEYGGKNRGHHSPPAPRR